MKFCVAAPLIKAQSFNKGGRVMRIGRANPATVAPGRRSARLMKAVADRRGRTPEQGTELSIPVPQSQRTGTGCALRRTELKASRNQARHQQQHLISFMAAVSYKRFSARDGQRVATAATTWDGREEVIKLQVTMLCLLLCGCAPTPMTAQQMSEAIADCVKHGLGWQALYEPLSPSPHTVARIECTPPTKESTP